MNYVQKLKIFGDISTQKAFKIMCKIAFVFVLFWDPGEYGGGRRRQWRRPLIDFLFRPQLPQLPQLLLQQLMRQATTAAEGCAPGSTTPAATTGRAH